MLLLKFTHLLSLSVWVGSMIFFSFMAAPAIFKALPRETAGDVVARIFPQYYKLGCLCSVLALGSLPLISSPDPGRLFCLGGMTALSFYAALVMGPKVRRLKSALRAAEGDIEAKKRQFSKLHGLSMGLNMLVLAMGLVLIFLTSLKFAG